MTATNNNSNEIKKTIVPNENFTNQNLEKEDQPRKDQQQKRNA